MTTHNQMALEVPAYDEENLQGQQKRNKRLVVVRLFSIMLLLLLVVMATLTASGTGKQPGFPARPSLHHVVQAYTSTPTPLPTLVPTSTLAPPPIPTPQPVVPFPNGLSAQIAALQAHDRFFYHGNTDLPEIALTFDDGPNPANTPLILDVLKKYQVPATFFDVGRLVQLYPDLAKRELAEGHLVGNHTWTHADLPFLTPNDIQKQLQSTSNIIEQVVGVRPIFFRPPYGNFNTSVLSKANTFGLTTVLWNSDAKDWSVPGTSVIAWRVINSVHNGTIILLHDGGGNRLQTVGALPTIIEQLLARHYQFVTMAQLVAHVHGKPATTPTPTPTPSRHYPQFASVGWLGRRDLPQLSAF